MYKRQANTRANFLFECANIVKRRRNEINSWMISEVGKNFIEADADTAEAIDFLEYYGREMIRYSKIEQPIQVPGEINQLEYLPLGVGAVIPPWNFPFAILVGMTSVSYTHLRAHETVLDLVCRLMLDKTNNKKKKQHNHSKPKKL